MKFLYPELKKIKTSDEIVNITIGHNYFSKNLQGFGVFLLLLLPHPGNHLRHHSGTQSSFGNASVEQGPKLAAETNEAINKSQSFRFAMTNITVFLKH